MLLRKVIRCLIVAMIMISLSQTTFAQAIKRSFVPGDLVRIFYEKKWQKATVLNAEKNAVAVEFTSNGRRQQEVFHIDYVRYEWEAEAISPIRAWSSQDKQYRIVAAAMSIEEGKLRLYTLDSKQIEIEVAKLSEEDQRYLKKLEKFRTGGVPKPPELSDFTYQSKATWSAGWDNSDTTAVAPDPTPKALANVPMAGIMFPRIGSYETVNYVEPIGGGDGWIVAGTHGTSTWEETPSRILWGSLKRKQFECVQFLPQGHRLVAIDAASRQAVSVIDSERRLLLCLWEADPTMRQIVGKKMWESRPSGSMYSAIDNQVEILSRNLVLHQHDDKKFVVWDTEQETVAYIIEQESFFDASLVLSPSKKYIAVPEDKRLRVLDSQTGDVLANLACPERIAGAAFSPDGTLVGALTHYHVYVWSLGSSDPPKVYRASAIGTPFSAKINFIDNNTLLTDGRSYGRTLFDLKQGVPIWSYQNDIWDIVGGWTSKQVGRTFASKLCYATKLSDDGFVIGVVDLPGPLVRQATDELTRSKLIAIAPGHRIKLITECGQYDAQVRKWLSQKIEDNLWVEDVTAMTTLKATMGRSPGQAITYREFSSNKDTTAVVAPYFSSLTLSIDGMTAWSSGSESGSPSFVYVDRDSSAQEQINKMEKPDPDFFKDVVIPLDFIHPRFEYGIGVSSIGINGIVPVKVEPKNIVNMMQDKAKADQAPQTTFADPTVINAPKKEPTDSTSKPTSPRFEFDIPIELAPKE
jgi:hypothetical protein